MLWFWIMIFYQKSECLLLWKKFKYVYKCVFALCQVFNPPNNEPGVFYILLLPGRCQSVIKSYQNKYIWFSPCYLCMPTIEKITIPYNIVYIFIICCINVACCYLQGYFVKHNSRTRKPYQPSRKTVYSAAGTGDILFPSN